MSMSNFSHILQGGLWGLAFSVLSAIRRNVQNWVELGNLAVVYGLWNICVRRTTFYESLCQSPFDNTTCTVTPLCGSACLRNHSLSLSWDRFDVSVLVEAIITKTYLLKTSFSLWPYYDATVRSVTHVQWIWEVKSWLCRHWLLKYTPVFTCYSSRCTQICEAISACSKLAYCGFGFHCSCLNVCVESACRCSMRGLIFIWLRRLSRSVVRWVIMQRWREMMTQKFSFVQKILMARQCLWQM